MAWQPIEPAAAGTIDPATGHQRLRAFRLPDFRDFIPF
jgi:hypothetical protein